jgi:hypothetical protein
MPGELLPGRFGTRSVDPSGMRGQGGDAGSAGAYASVVE